MAGQLMNTKEIVAGFRDLAYFLHLRECLWRKRAAVMIGSGFSLNAIQRPGAMPMVTWNGFASQLARAVYADSPTRRDEAASGALEPSGMLRLGATFESAFGRTALDNLIVDLVPDNDYEPGDIHCNLVSLPWMDVLTTNYDTLLERASLSAPEAGYEIVVTDADIARATRPRIVKLHGSLPSSRPFVFTDEDFRQYPSHRPAMVNLVQQTMLENSLCLIGFSGSDPNYINWTGWVRDRLGDATPNIYMVSLTRISQADRDQLRRRHTIPIDLSFLRDINALPPRSQSKMVKWFLRSLNAGRPADVLDWPDELIVADGDAFKDIPPCIPGEPELSAVVRELEAA